MGPFALSRHIDMRSGKLPAAEISGDADSLRVMICNLLDNAIRYIPEHGSVQIDLVITATAIELTIQDSGQGIHQNERSRIFDRFYRVSGTKQSGSGLGLAIAKTVADRHKAHIELADAALGGLAVKILFPL